MSFIDPIYDGDVHLLESFDGGQICIKDGQVLMDAGLETAVYISLYTSQGYWANPLIRQNSFKYGSNFETSTYDAINIQTLLLIEEEAKAALNWLITERVASEINVEAFSESLNRVRLNITITQPNDQSVTYTYFNNWVGQVTLNNHEVNCNEC